MCSWFSQQRMGVIFSMQEEADFVSSQLEYSCHEAGMVNYRKDQRVLLSTFPLFKTCRTLQKIRTTAWFSEVQGLYQFISFCLVSFCSHPLCFWPRVLFLRWLLKDVDHETLNVIQLVTGSITPIYSVPTHSKTVNLFTADFNVKYLLLLFLFVQLKCVLLSHFNPPHCICITTLVGMAFFVSVKGLC